MLLRFLYALALFAGFYAPRQTEGPVKGNETDGPAYTADKRLRFPAQYRQWIYLTSGMDMSYKPKADPSGHSMFDNVFVNPSSYREFLKAGTWPDGTTLILENRGAIHGGEAGASINKHGLTQTEEVMGLEVHVKDASLPGGWGFYNFDNTNSVKIIARPATCYTCHEQHAAVDTTFIQFYPTLIGVARTKGTLSKEYLKQISASPH